MRHGVAMLAIVVGWCLLPPQVRTGEAYTHFDANGWYKLIPPSTLFGNDLSAPLFIWEVVGCFRDSSECYASLKEVPVKDATCVPGTDPRLVKGAGWDLLAPP